MDLRQLGYVLKLADTQSLTKAAEESFVTPSALSQFISKLEQEMGTPLFKRVKGGWPLTHAGVIYVDVAREILKLQKAMKRDIEDIVKGEKGTIHVGIMPGRISRQFANIYPRFKERYPDIKIVLLEGHVRQLEEMLLKGQTDIIFNSNILNNPALKYEVLLREPFVLAVPAEHPLAVYAVSKEKGKLATVDLRLFRDVPFLLASSVITLRNVTDVMFAKAGFKPKILFESSSASTLYDLAEKGFGATLIPMGSMRKTDLSVYCLTTPSGVWETTVAYLHGTRLSQAEKYFIELADHFFKKEYNWVIQK